MAHGYQKQQPSIDSMEPPPPYPQAVGQHSENQQQLPTGYPKPSTREHSNGDNKPFTTTPSRSSVVHVAQPSTSVVEVDNPAPYSYIIPAVLSCICCCWILGLAAVIAASVAQHESSIRNYDKARRSANIAKILTGLSVVCGIAVYIAAIVIIFKR